ncbi:DMT family transporter [Bordetella holmesii]|uniref:DMT family transporter n=1 Tax=Bordetella holmesii TaxID=35814 RepID=UPI001A97F978|nr:DMT family transporter [Bordetella holmesii]MBO1262425.1 DMT family transporter [Bordetella holmesii]
MTAIRRPLDGLATGAMVVLCLCWAAKQIAIKAVAADVAPLLQIGLRSAFAAAVLGLVVLRTQGTGFWRDGSLRPGLGVGVLFALEFVFVALGLHYTTASHMAVFLYTSPIFAALGLHAWVPGERLRPLQWLGVTLAFAGIALTFLGKHSPTDTAPDMLLGDLLGILAGAAWGMTTVGIRASRLSEAPASKTLFYQMVCAALILPLLHGVMGGAAATWTVTALYSLLFQSVVVALMSYLAWFWLLRRYLATRFSMWSFLTPLFGVGLGVILIDDPLDGHFAAGAALVLAGITLVSAAGTLQTWWARRRCR